jgi:hypothetical protein
MGSAFAAATHRRLTATALRPRGIAHLADTGGREPTGRCAARRLRLGPALATPLRRSAAATLHLTAWSRCAPAPALPLVGAGHSAGVAAVCCRAGWSPRWRGVVSVGRARWAVLPPCESRATCAGLPPNPPAEKEIRLLGSGAGWCRRHEGLETTSASRARVRQCVSLSAPCRLPGDHPDGRGSRASEVTHGSIVPFLASR